MLGPSVMVTSTGIEQLLHPDAVCVISTIVVSVPTTSVGGVNVLFVSPVNRVPPALLFIVLLYHW